MNRFWPWLQSVLVAAMLLAVGQTAVGQTAVAQQPALTSSAEVAYGQKVTFRLIGSVNDTVDKIVLFVNMAASATPLSVEVRFSQDKAQLVAGYDLDPTLADLPPFSEIVYWWELTTAESETITVSEERFIYRDDRFDWRKLSNEDVTVYWTGNDAELGQIAWEIVADSRQLLDRLLPQSVASPLNLYIYPSTADLRAGLRLAGRDWQDEHSDPDLGVLLVTAVNPLTAAADLSRTIPHELAHLRLHRLVPAITLPQWYEEGLALVVEENNYGDDDLLVHAVADGNTLTLLTLCTNFPDAPPEADLALTQSRSLLRYIQSQFGDQALRQLGTNYLVGTSCEAGLRQTLDMSLAELNADWLAAQAPQPAWLTFLSQNGLWLLLVAASFGLLALILRK